jgi:hypothetical protein
MERARAISTSCFGGAQTVERIARLASEPDDIGERCRVAFDTRMVDAAEAITRHVAKPDVLRHTEIAKETGMLVDHRNAVAAGIER